VVVGAAEKAKAAEATDAAAYAAKAAAAYADAARKTAADAARKAAADAYEAKMVAADADPANKVSPTMLSLYGDSIAP
jgi:hypothetical protein